MKKIRNIIYSILGICFLGACSEGFLDYTPSNKITDAAMWKIPADFIMTINAAYNEYEETDGNSNNLANYPLFDLATKEANDLIGYYDVTKFNWVWDQQYKAIHKVNLVLANIDNGMITDESMKNRIVAEAKFLRGFSYFRLARCFGGVPIILKPKSASDSKDDPRASLEETWAQVISDLSESAALLPEVWADFPNYEEGRPLKGTALAFRMLAYMELGKWDQAIADFKSVEASKRGYKILPTHREVFSYAAENSQESIMELQYQGADGWFRVLNSQFIQEWTVPSGSGGAYSKFGGWGNWFVSKQYAESFEPGDLRRSTCFLGVGEKYKGELFPDTFQLKEGSSPTGYITTKYWLGKDSYAGAGSSQNIPVLRYSEVLLNYAECLMRTNNLTGAYTEINKIRSRAGLTALSASTPAQCLKDLNNERRHELFLEMNFYFDLIRTNQIKEYLKDNYNVDFADHWKLLPIPQSEIDNNLALKGKQNPGY